MIDLRQFAGWDDVLMPESMAAEGHAKGVFLVFQFDEPDPDDPRVRARRRILLPLDGARALRDRLTEVLEGEHE